MKVVSTIGLVLASLSGLALADDAKEIGNLKTVLKKHGFTGAVELSIPKELGRPLDPKRREIGRMIFFDNGLGLHKDNSCAGCHSPTHGMGDTQSIARGIQNDNIVGLLRQGPRNQRRTPTVVNTGFYPALMWNGRFSAVSGNPFDNSKGFLFPPPEGRGPEGIDLFGKGDSRFKHLLVAQAHIPFTETPEMAGFTGLCNQPFIMPRSIPAASSPLKLSTKSVDVRFQNKALGKVPGKDESDPNCEFDDGKGIPVPKPYPPAGNLILNAPIRHAVLGEINRMPEYRRLFSEVYPTVNRGNDIEFWMIGETLAEFQISLTMTDAPIDQFARGKHQALSGDARKGALLFFGKKAGCVLPFS
jgi:cytochrome c peroxidase